MTSGVVERFTEATSAREMRALEAVAARTLDALAERTVWCATASVPAGRAARALRDRLGWAGEHGVIARLLEFGRGAETRAFEGVAPDDVVVLHDPAPAGLAEQIRDGGGHALLRVRAGARATHGDARWSAWPRSCPARSPWPSGTSRSGNAAADNARTWPGRACWPQWRAGIGRKPSAVRFTPDRWSPCADQPGSTSRTRRSWAGGRLERRRWPCPSPRQ